MQTIKLHLGIIQDVNTTNKTLDIIDITKSNLSTVDYKSVYTADISEYQVLPQKGYMVLFMTLGAATVPGMTSIALPIKYFSSILNGENIGSIKKKFVDVLQCEGDQLQTSTNGTALGVLNNAVLVQAGNQQLLIDKANSQTKIKYDSLKIEGKDGLTITQMQGSDKLVIIKGGTTITVDDDNVDIQASNVTIGGETTIKGQSLVQWLNNHTHSNGNMGSPTGTPMMELDEDILVKE